MGNFISKPPEVQARIPEFQARMPEFQARTLVWPTETVATGDYLVLYNSCGTMKGRYKKSKIKKIDKTNLEYKCRFSYTTYDVTVVFKDNTEAFHQDIRTIGSETGTMRRRIVLSKEERAELIKAHTDLEKRRFAQHERNCIAYWETKKKEGKQKSDNKPPAYQEFIETPSAPDK